MVKAIWHKFVAPAGCVINCSVLPPKTKERKIKLKLGNDIMYTTLAKCFTNGDNYISRMIKGHFKEGKSTALDLSEIPCASSMFIILPYFIDPEGFMSELRSIADPIKLYILADFLSIPEDDLDVIREFALDKCAERGAIDFEDMNHNTTMRLLTSCATSSFPKNNSDYKWDILVNIYTWYVQDDHARRNRMIRMVELFANCETWDNLRSGSKKGFFTKDQNIPYVMQLAMKPLMSMKRPSRPAIELDDDSDAVANTQPIVLSDDSTQESNYETDDDDIEW